MNPEHFWSLTPRRFALIAQEALSRQRADREAADARAALLAAILANQNRRKGQKAWRVNDFMPKAAARKAQSVEDMMLAMRQWRDVTAARHRSSTP